MRSPLLSNGSCSRAVRASACRAIEINKARCLMRRARFSDCGSPSTRQLCSEPNPLSDTRWTSRVITHLQEFPASRGTKLRREPPEVAAGGRHRARRDVRCAPSVLLDTEECDKCPKIRNQQEARQQTLLNRDRCY